MKRNDLFYSVSLSVFFSLLAGIYFYQYHIKNKNEGRLAKTGGNVEVPTPVIQTDYDPNLIDTLSDFKINEQETWASLHPNGKYNANEYGGYSEKMMIRRMHDVNFSSNDFHTTIHRLFYYKSLGKQKVFVVLISYPYDSSTGNRDECHGCAPNYDIANFVYENGVWNLENYIIDWIGALGSWGEPVQLEFGMSELGYTLGFENCFCQGGNCECYMVLYSIPSLKIIKDKTYETSDKVEIGPEEDSIDVDETGLIDSLQ